MTVYTGTLITSVGSPTWDNTRIYDAYQYNTGYEYAFVAGLLDGLLEGADPMEVTQSVARTVSKRILESATGQPLTLTSTHTSTAVVQLKKIGGAFATISPTLTIRGTYLDLDLTSGNLDTLGDCDVTIDIPTAVPASIKLSVIAMNKADAVRAGLTAIPNANAGTSEGVALYKQVENIAVTGAALNKTATSRTITTGTGTGGVTNTTGVDSVYDNVADSGGTIDFFYEFQLASITSGVGVGVRWTGYLVGVVNTLDAFAFNWNSSSWDQVGSIAGISGTLNGVEDWELTADHTGTGGNLGLVRIRFQHTGLTTATLKTDQILTAYAVMPATATDVTNSQTAINSNTNSAVTAAQTAINSHTDSTVSAAQTAIIAAIPSATVIRDAILNAARSGHLTAGTIGEGIALATSLLQGNFYIDNIDNTNPNGPISQRLRCFVSGAAMAGVSYGGTGQGEFKTFLVATTYDGPNKTHDHKVVEQ